MDKPTLDTRTAMLLAARRLIAAKGVDGVSVRDILQAAGARNGGAVSYYFGAKEDMIRELIEKGARLIDQRRVDMLDALESVGHAVTLPQVIEILVNSSIGISTAPKGEDSFTRFLNAVQATHYALFKEVVGSRWNAGYNRLLDHIHRLLPQVPPEVLHQRLIFMVEFMNATLAKREAFIVEGGRLGGGYWKQPLIMDNLVYSLVGMLSGPAPPNAPQPGSA